MRPGDARTLDRGRRADAGPTLYGGEAQGRRKNYLGTFKCEAKGVVRGTPVAPLCLATVEEKFVAAFTSAESQGGCLTVGDAAAVEADVDVCVADLGPPPPTTSTSTTTSTTAFTCSTEGQRAGLRERSLPRGRLARQPPVRHRAELRAAEPCNLIPCSSGEVCTLVTGLDECCACRARE